ncbi:hypothetical protein QJQ45_020021 [Haematococcus lacustris]|nr:hypothetical protein QJQ45_020021 [Haematococcus lacustris]
MCQVRTDAARLPGMCIIRLLSPQHSTASQVVTVHQHCQEVARLLTCKLVERDAQVAKLQAELQRKDAENGLLLTKTTELGRLLDHMLQALQMALAHSTDGQSSREHVTAVTAFTDKPVIGPKAVLPEPTAMHNPLQSKPSTLPSQTASQEPALAAAQAQVVQVQSQMSQLHRTLQLETERGTHLNEQLVAVQLDLKVHRHMYHTLRLRLADALAERYHSTALPTPTPTKQEQHRHSDAKALLHAHRLNQQLQQYLGTCLQAMHLMSSAYSLTEEDIQALRAGAKPVRKEPRLAVDGHQGSLTCDSSAPLAAGAAGGNTGVIATYSNPDSSCFACKDSSFSFAPVGQAHSVLPPACLPSWWRTPLPAPRATQPAASPAPVPCWVSSPCAGVREQGVHSPCRSLCIADEQLFVPVSLPMLCAAS